MAGWFPLFAVPEQESGHNGGRSTINFSDLIYGQENPFLNQLKQANRWTVFGGSGADINVDPFSLDVNGYPYYITAGGIGHITEVYVPTQVERPGRYVIDWIGNGEVMFGGFPNEYADGYSSADLVSTTGQGRVEFLPTNNSGYFNYIGIRGIGSPRITNMRLYHIDDEELIGPIDNPTGNIFSPKLLASLVETRAGCYRFLSWPDNNKTNVTTWRTRKPVDYIYYGGSEFRAECFCDPAGNDLNGLVYSFAEPDVDASTGEAFVLQHGAMVQVKHTAMPVEATLSGAFTSANSSIAVTDHHVTVGRMVYVEAVSGGFPTNFVSGNPYWVVEVPDDAHIKVSATENGDVITPNASGTISIKPTISSRNASFASSSDTITLTAHRLFLGQQVFTTPIDEQPFPSTLNSGLRPLFVCDVADADHFKLSLTDGGAAITSNVTATVNVSPALFANVGGTEDILIRSEYGNGLSAGGNSYPMIDYRAYATMIYDADLNSWLKHGGDIAIGSTGISNGVPPEMQLALCIEGGAHYHALSPMYAMDPVTDYMPSLMAYVRDNAPPWLIPRWEPPNETWNTAAGFFNGVFALVKAYYHWGVADFNQWYGKITSTLGQTAAANYSISEASAKTQTKYHVLCGVQTVGGETESSTSGQDARLESSEYVDQDAPAQSGYTKTPAKNWVTRVAVAQYFTPSATRTQQEQDWSDEYAACEVRASIDGTDFHIDEVKFGTVDALKTLYGAMLPAGVTIISGADSDWVLSEDVGEISSERIMLGNMHLGVHDDFVLTCNTGAGQFTIDKVNTLYGNWKTWAKSKGIPGMCGYEGGFSPDFDSSSIEGSNPKDQFRAAAKLSTHLKGFVLDNYNNFIGHTDEDFIVDFPASYYGGTMPCSNVWQIIDNIYVLIPQPSYEAIVEFNN